MDAREAAAALNRHHRLLELNPGSLAALAATASLRTAASMREWSVARIASMAVCFVYCSIPSGQSSSSPSELPLTSIDSFIMG
jgi:hypothetical protein